MTGVVIFILILAVGSYFVPSFFDRDIFSDDDDDEDDEDDSDYSDSAFNSSL